MQTIKLTPYDNRLNGYKPGGEVVVLLDTTTGPFSVTLPDASDSENTKFTFVVIGSNQAVVVPVTGQFINTLISVTMSKDEIISVTAHQKKYYIVQKYSTALIFH